MEISDTYKIICITETVQVTVQKLKVKDHIQSRVALRSK